MGYIHMKFYNGSSHHEHCHWLHPCLLIYGVEKCWDSISIEVASSVHGLLSSLLWLVLHSVAFSYVKCSPDRFSHKWKSLKSFSILTSMSVISKHKHLYSGLKFVIYVYNRKKEKSCSKMWLSWLMLQITFIICAILSLFSSRGYPPSLWCLTSSRNSPYRYEVCAIPASLTVCGVRFGSNLL